MLSATPEEAEYLSTLLPGDDLIPFSFFEPTDPFKPFLLASLQ